MRRHATSTCLACLAKLSLLNAALLNFCGGALRTFQPLSPTGFCHSQRKHEHLHKNLPKCAELIHRTRVHCVESLKVFQTGGSTIAAMASTSHLHTCGLTRRLEITKQLSSRPVRLRRTTLSGTLRRSSCSIMKSGVKRVTSASVREHSDVVTEKESSQSQEAGPSFRFMAEGNMWLLEFEASGLRVLADPWLVENQTFWNQAWLYTGRSQSRQKGGFPGDLTMEYVNSVDAILISQEWEDHCHLPTLKLLRKDIPVIASPKAANIVQRLGFSDVRSLAHGTCTQIPGLRVWATVGGRVGPPWALRENGFVLQEMQTGLRVYYEPHCSFEEESVRSVSPVDVVITPGRQYKVAGFPLTESVEEALKLLHILKPQLVVPIQLTPLEMTGWSAPLLQLIGSVNDFEADLRKAGIKARVVEVPLSGQFVHVQLGSQNQACC